MTPDEAADITEICQLKHAYAWNYDTRDPDALADLFTEDAECVFGPYGTWRGKQELYDGYVASMRRMEGRFPGIHAVTNPLIEVDGDEATGRWYLLDEFFGPSGEEPLKIVGVYHERYRREQGRWLIARSEIEFLWSADRGRISGRMTEPVAPPSAA